MLKNVKENAGKDVFFLICYNIFEMFLKRCKCFYVFFLYYKNKYVW